jgi:hypothetical protein
VVFFLNIPLLPINSIIPVSHFQAKVHEVVMASRLRFATYSPVPARKLRGLRLPCVTLNPFLIPHALNAWANGDDGKDSMKCNEIFKKKKKISEGLQRFKKRNF